VRYIIGIDEVGRGALAGPVAVAAVCIPKGVRIANRAFGKLRDSKKLTAKKREAWAGFLKDHPRVRSAVARVYPRRIERMNIAEAANLAALRAFKKLTTNYQLLTTRCAVFLDGGLYLGSRVSPSTSSQPTQGYGGQAGRMAVKTIVRGDEKIATIKLASIIAKVSRDRLMTRLAKKHPRYGFDVHKGYGTKAHFAALRKHGPSKAHRLTFVGKGAKVARS